jgi:aspartate ammonia-lyase
MRISQRYVPTSQQQQTVDYQEHRQETVVDFSGGREITRNLSELVNQTFVIANIEFQEITYRGQNTVISIITLSNGQKYHTFSTILIEQLKNIKQITDSGKMVRVKLIKTKRYYQFTKP